MLQDLEMQRSATVRLLRRRFPLDASLVAVSTDAAVWLRAAATHRADGRRRRPRRARPVAPRRAAVPGLVARCAGVGASGAALSAKAQDDFVAARQADRSVSADDLGRWLTLARLVAASAARRRSPWSTTSARMLERARAERISGARSVGV